MVVSVLSLSLLRSADLDHLDNGRRVLHIPPQGDELVALVAPSRTWQDWPPPDGRVLVLGASLLSPIGQHFVLICVLL